MSIFRKKDEKNNKNMLERKQSYNDPMISFRSRMNNLFDSFFEDWGLEPFSEPDSLSYAGFTPQIDVTEDEKAIYVEAELPGLKENEIDVELKDNLLTISGEKKSESEQKDKKYHRIERSYGYFQRAVSIDPKIEEDKIKANYKNGILRIELPKDTKAIKEEQPRKIKIN